MSGPLSLEVMTKVVDHIRTIRDDIMIILRVVFRDVHRPICNMKDNYGAYSIYKDARTRTAVEGQPIDIMNRPLTAHEESRGDERPSQNTHRSNNGPMRVIGEGLFNHTRRGDREASERVQRNCGDKRDDPPCEENQRQRHHNASPLLGFVNGRLARRVEWNSPKA